MGKNPDFSNPKDKPPHPAKRSIKVGFIFEKFFIVLINFFYYESFFENLGIMN